jgi:cob(I)alamin adenosyltransferase
MAFYTKKGDDGSTGLLGKERVKKYDLRMETIGCLDEVNAALGVCKAFSSSNEIQEIIFLIQKQLYKMMGEVSSEKEIAGQFPGITDADISTIENTIDVIGKRTTIPREFIVPGDTKGGALLSLARTIVRRAERRLVELLDAKVIENKKLLQFINRLSSLLFVLELYENQISGKGKQTLVK